MSINIIPSNHILKKIKHYEHSFHTSLLNKDSKELVEKIDELIKLPVQAIDLFVSNIGRTVNSMRKVEDPIVSFKASELIMQWRNLVRAYILNLLIYIEEEIRCLTPIQVKLKNLKKFGNKRKDIRSIQSQYKTVEEYLYEKDISEYYIKNYISEGDYAYRRHKKRIKLSYIYDTLNVDENISTRSGRNVKKVSYKESEDIIDDDKNVKKNENKKRGRPPKVLKEKKETDTKKGHNPSTGGNEFNNGKSKNENTDINTPKNKKVVGNASKDEDSYTDTSKGKNKSKDKKTDAGTSKGKRSDVNTSNDKKTDTITTECKRSDVKESQNENTNVTKSKGIESDVKNKFVIPKKIPQTPKIHKTDIENKSEYIKKKSLESPKPSTSSNNFDTLFDNSNSHNESSKKNLLQMTIDSVLTKNDIINYFSSFGEIIKCDIGKNSNSGIVKTFANVWFKNESSLDGVFKVENHYIREKIIFPKRYISLGLINKNKVFLSGLPYNVTEKDLEVTFKQFGPIARTQIIYHKDTKKSRGLGFVSFENLTSFNQCLEKQFIIMNDKKVEIKEYNNYGKHFNY